ncbi:MAG: metallophosphoesterase [Wenzhouxiangella sp.]|nr:metallophosphoesterase [Wenzhouxiangella sp.]
MTQPFTLLQLSDLHLSADLSAQYRGQNADANLESLLPACRLLAPGGLILSGDVSEDGSAESYRRALHLTKDLAPLTGWIPGNHDVRDVMGEIFEPAGFASGPVLEWGQWQIALLDSAMPGRPEGQLDEARLAPLKSLSGERPAMVFVHHQPVAVGSPWIDKYPLKEPDRLWAQLNPATVKMVAFGHVHQAFSGEHGGVACLSGPSTVANSQPGSPRFTLDPTGPKARWFRLWPEGRWLSGIVSAG